MGKMEGNWIKDHRKVLDWEWFTDVNTAHLFRYLCLKASFKDTSYRGKPVKRGTLFLAASAISVETGLSLRQIRTSVKKLESTNNIKTQATNQGTHFEIVNYDKYQAEKHTGATNQTTSGTLLNNRDSSVLSKAERQADRQAKGQAKDSAQNTPERQTSRQTSDKRATNGFLYKEDNKKERKKEIYTKKDFEKIWEVYPNNELMSLKKPHHKSKFEKLIPIVLEEITPDELIEVIKAYAAEVCNLEKHKSICVDSPAKFFAADGLWRDWVNKIKNQEPKVIQLNPHSSWDDHFTPIKRMLSEKAVFDNFARTTEIQQINGKSIWIKPANKFAEKQYNNNTNSRITGLDPMIETLKGHFGVENIIISMQEPDYNEEKTA